MSSKLKGFDRCSRQNANDSRNYINSSLKFGRQEEYSLNPTCDNQSSYNRSITCLVKKDAAEFSSNNSLDTDEKNISTENSSNYHGDILSKQNKSDYRMEKWLENKCKGKKSYCLPSGYKRQYPPGIYTGSRVKDKTSRRKIHRNSNSSKRKYNPVIDQSLTAKNCKKIKTLITAEEIGTQDASHIKSNLDIDNNPEELIDIYNPKLPVSKLELIKEGLKNELDKVKQECLTKVINTKNKSYVMFIDSSELEVGLRDIITFIKADYDINAMYVLEDTKFFLELIKYVDQNEKLFWKNSGFSELSDIEKIKHKLIDSIGKFNFCKHDSPFLTYFPGLIHMKLFVENLIIEDINLVKNACLWILLLKYVESLTFVSIKDPNASGKCHKTYFNSKYKGYKIYAGNEYILCKMKELYETFDAIVRHVFLKAKISTKFSVMFDFIRINLQLSHKDIYVSDRKRIVFSKVLTDCILRTKPEVISSFILQLKNQKCSNLNLEFFFNSTNKFLKAIFSKSIELNDVDIKDIKAFYVEVALAYIDFFKKEAACLDFSNEKYPKCIQKMVKIVKEVFETDQVQKQIKKLTDLTALMSVTEDLCFLSNYIIKSGLNNQAYSEIYQSHTFKACQFRLSKNSILFATIKQQKINLI
ncbi:hypothetical protein CWI36_0317p0040 [Hamiltosporidium magnivora]|uniref:Uncharacterized protein n=1 Tax=Hamiltosporidium magnivora TaxID=148818 RepID=A0A4Q9LGD5_9MICR|nr:hypothetical protein CWI36_0317p0040 [Hamiltosporidium magnivora]